MEGVKPLRIPRVKVTTGVFFLSAISYQVSMICAVLSYIIYLRWHPTCYSMLPCSRRSATLKISGLLCTKRDGLLVSAPDSQLGDPDSSFGSCVTDRRRRKMPVKRSRSSLPNRWGDFNCGWGFNVACVANLDGVPLFTLQGRSARCSTCRSNL